MSNEGVLHSHIEAPIWSLNELILDQGIFLVLLILNHQLKLVLLRNFGAVYLLEAFLLVVQQDIQQVGNFEIEVIKVGLEQDLNGERVDEVVHSSDSVRVLVELQFQHANFVFLDFLVHRVLQGRVRDFESRCIVLQLDFQYFMDFVGRVLDVQLQVVVSILGADPSEDLDSRGLLPSLHLGRLKHLHFQARKLRLPALDLLLLLLIHRLSKEGANRLFL